MKFPYAEKNCDPEFFSGNNTVIYTGNSDNSMEKLKNAKKIFMCISLIIHYSGRNFFLPPTIPGSRWKCSRGNELLNAHSLCIPEQLPEKDVIVFLLFLPAGAAVSDIF